MSKVTEKQIIDWLVLCRYPDGKTDLDMSKATISLIEVLKHKIDEQDQWLKQFRVVASYHQDMCIDEGDLESCETCSLISAYDNKDKP